MKKTLWLIPVMSKGAEPAQVRAWHIAAEGKKTRLGAPTREALARLGDLHDALKRCGETDAHGEPRDPDPDPDATADRQRAHLSTVRNKQDKGTSRLLEAMAEGSRLEVELAKLRGNDELLAQALLTPWEVIATDVVSEIPAFIETFYHIPGRMSDGARRTGTDDVDRYADDGHLRVLLVFADSTEASQLRQRREREALLDLFQVALQPSQQIRVELLDPLTRLDQLDAKVREAHGFDIVYWSGHGEPSGLKLGGDTLDPGALTRALSAGGTPPRLVFLNACHSADARAPKGPSLVRALIEAGTETLVAMRYSVYDAVSRRLAVHFFANLLGPSLQLPVSRALQQARFRVAEEQRLPQEAPSPDGGKLLPLVDLFTPLTVGSRDLRFVPPRGTSRYLLFRPEGASHLSPAWETRFLRPARSTGQRELVQELLAWTSSSAPLAAVHGAAGSGKTNAVAEFIRTVQRDFDAIVPVDVPETGLVPPEPFREIGRQLRSLGHGQLSRLPLWESDILADDEGPSPTAKHLADARQSLLQALVRHRILLVLDQRCGSETRNPDPLPPCEPPRLFQPRETQACIVPEGDPLRVWARSVTKRIAEIPRAAEGGVDKPTSDLLYRLAWSLVDTGSRILVCSRAAWAPPSGLNKGIVRTTEVKALERPSAKRLLESFPSLDVHIARWRRGEDRVAWRCIMGALEDVTIRCPAFARTLAGELCDAERFPGQARLALTEVWPAIHNLVERCLSDPMRFHLPSAPDGRRWTWQHPILKTRFHWVPPGRFWMGSSTDPAARFYDDRADENETPPHEETTRRGYWMAEVPVTDRQYEMFLLYCRYPPPPSWRLGRHSSDGRPVTGVSYLDAMEYGSWLTSVGLMPPGCTGYRLPTEAQWERAARGTEGQRYPWGEAPPDLDLAWYGRDFDEGPARVGLRPEGQSPARCQDMAGNVWEWCRDLWRGNYLEKPLKEAGSLLLRPARGGSFHTLPDFIHCAVRASFPMTSRHPGLGFRLVCE